MKRDFSCRFLAALVFAAVLLCGAAGDIFAAPKMYWTDCGNHKIQSANLDGTQKADILSDLHDPRGVALDGAGKIYWTDYAAGKIQRAKIDGSNVEVLITGLSNPSDIELDVSGGKIYWVETIGRCISRANLDGSEIEDVILNGLKYPKAIAVDVTGGKIYWADSWYPANIKRANLDGSGAEELVTGGLIDPSGIALDLINGKMYWTDAGGSVAKIERANLDGSAREKVIDKTGLWWPRGIALDAAGGKMYWIDSWSPGKIRSAKLNGTSAKDLVGSLNNPSDIAIDIVEPNSLRISGLGTVIEDSEAQYTAKAYYNDGSSADVTAGVVWSVSPAGYASIDENGLLSIGSISTFEDVVVTGQYTVGKVTVEARMDVKVARPVDFRVTGPANVRGNWQWQYGAIVDYNSGQSRNVTNSAIWEVSPSAYASIDEKGVLHTGEVSDAQDIIVTARYNRSAVLLEKGMSVRISPPGILRVPGEYGTIQSAIDAAINRDTVIVADGTHSGYGNYNIYFRGKAITVRSENGPNNCIVDCQGRGRGFRFSYQEGAKSVLEGFTITGGSGSGGGVYCYNGSSPTIVNCVLSGNYGSWGGGVRCNSYSNPVISGCIIRGNSATYGGGIYCYNSNPVVTDCVISGNTADDGGGVCNSYSNPTLTGCVIGDNIAKRYGGGMYNEYSNPVLSGCTIRGNSGDYGGGIYNDNGSTTLTGCIISGNTAGEWGGGVSNLGNLTLINCTISGNEAYIGGGADNEGSLLLNNCSVTGNSAVYVGGIVNVGDSMTLNGCAIADNSASIIFGGIYCYGRNGSRTINNCTISGNSDTEGISGIYCVATTLDIANSIIWGNKPSELIAEGSEVSWSYSVVGSDGWSGTKHDPCFVGTGEEVRDYHLRADSTCINAGDPGYTAGPNETDLDGKPRVIGGRVDMGAYEFNHIPVADAGPDMEIYAWIDGIAQITLDGSGSFDADGDMLSYQWVWTVDGQTYNSDSVNPVIELPAGTHTIELVVNDGLVDSQPDEVVITVVPPLEAAMKFTPQTLNCGSSGQWVKAHFVMPEGFLPADVDANKPAEIAAMGIKSAYMNVFVNDAGLVEVEAAFGREAFCGCVTDGLTKVEVVGTLASGRYFRGSDTIVVKDR